MTKNSEELLATIEELRTENRELQKLLFVAKESIDAIKAGNIDAVVVTHKKNLKIYTGQTADKIYRILIEKMHEGAVTLNAEGTVLYSNSYFAKMICLPLQKVIGTKFKNFIEPSSISLFMDLFKKGWEGYSHGEVYLMTEEGNTVPALMSVNTLSLDNNFVLSIILTDLTFQNQRKTEFKSLVIEKIINVVKEMIDNSDASLKINYSDYIREKLNYDYTYLSNTFSETKGITIQQYIIVYKIEKAKELLLFGNLNLSEISYKLHYQNVSHLSAQFKKITGFSASQYKKMKRRSFGEQAGVVAEKVPHKNLIKFK